MTYPHMQVILSAIANLQVSPLQSSRAVTKDQTRSAVVTAGSLRRERRGVGGRVAEEVSVEGGRVGVGLAAGGDVGDDREAVSPGVADSGEVAGGVLGAHEGPP